MVNGGGTGVGTFAPHSLRLVDIGWARFYDSGVVITCGDQGDFGAYVDGLTEGVRPTS